MMKDWVAQAPAWFGDAEREVAGFLHLWGQDNEVLAFGIVVLGLLLALAAAWAFLLGLLQGFFGLFGGSKPEPVPEGPDLRDLRYEPAQARDEPGRLDVVPSARSVARVPGGSGKRPRVEPAAPAADEPEAKRSMPGKSQTRLAQAAGAAGSKGQTAHGALGGVRRVNMRSLPNPAPRGSVVSARPEWTGKVVPGSLEEAGAVEVCKVLSRRAAFGGSAPVRAVDYRVCGLPRVDSDGRRQPDVLVYTVADRGFLPKGAAAKSVKR